MAAANPDFNVGSRKLSDIVAETEGQVGDLNGAVREGEFLPRGESLAEGLIDVQPADHRPFFADELGRLHGPADNRPFFADESGRLHGPKPASAGDASIQRTIEQLREFGFTPEEIAEILASGG
jgi:hypothetical protein